MKLSFFDTIKFVLGRHFFTEEGVNQIVFAVVKEIGVFSNFKPGRNNKLGVDILGAGDTGKLGGVSLVKRDAKETAWP